MVAEKWEPCVCHLRRRPFESNATSCSGTCFQTGLVETVTVCTVVIKPYHHKAVYTYGNNILKQ